MIFGPEDLCQGTTLAFSQSECSERWLRSGVPNMRAVFARDGVEVQVLERSALNQAREIYEIAWLC